MVGPPWLRGLALIWSPAPGIPPPPHWRRAFPAGLLPTEEITSFPFLFWAGGLAENGGGGGEGEGGDNRQANKLLSAWWEQHMQSGAKGTPRPPSRTVQTGGGSGAQFASHPVTRFLSSFLSTSLCCLLSLLEASFVPKV